LLRSHPQTVPYFNTSYIISLLLFYMFTVLLFWHFHDVEPHNKHNDILCFRYELHFAYDNISYQPDNGLFNLKHEAI
jgi:hypothetical protein